MRTKVTVHDDFITLRIDDVRLIFKQPNITPFHTYVYHDARDIMYFYYTLMMYQKRGKVWKKVHTARITEFGIMNHLARYIQELLDINCRKEGIRHYFNERKRDGTVVKSKTEFQAMYPFDIAGMFAEDAFNFTKYYKTFTDCRGKMEFEFYDLTISIGGNECGKSAFGVRFERLGREDLEIIKQFADECMKLSDRIAKENIERWITDDTDSPYNDPKIIRDHLKCEYGITEWRPVLEKMCTKEYVLDEYIDYITGKKQTHELRCHEWHGEERTMEEMLKVMPDYEAYLHIIDDNEDNYCG